MPSVEDICRRYGIKEVRTSVEVLFVLFSQSQVSKSNIEKPK